MITCGSVQLDILSLKRFLFKVYLQLQIYTEHIIALFVELFKVHIKWLVILQHDCIKNIAHTYMLCDKKKSLKLKSQSNKTH